MKYTLGGRAICKDWYGLDIFVRLGSKYEVVIETVSWEVWKITVITPRGAARSLILRKVGDTHPRISLSRTLYNRLTDGWHWETNGLTMEDC